MSAEASAPAAPAGPYFLGSSAHKLDVKNRVHVPLRFRQPDRRGRGDSAGVVFDRFFLIPWEEDKCVFLLTPDQFDQLAREIPTTALSGEGAQADRDRQRDFFSKVEVLDLDAQGRITLPPAIMEHLFGEDQGEEDGSREVMMVGAGQRAEIWNPAHR